MKGLVLACLLIGCVRIAQERIDHQAEASRRAMDTFGCRQAATRLQFTPPKGVRAMYEGGAAMPVPTVRVDGDGYDGCMAARGYRPNPQ